MAAYNDQSSLVGAMVLHLGESTGLCAVVVEDDVAMDKVAMETTTA